MPWNEVMSVRRACFVRGMDALAISYTEGGRPRKLRIALDSPPIKFDIEGGRLRKLRIELRIALDSSPTKSDPWEWPPAPEAWYALGGLIAARAGLVERCLNEFCVQWDRPAAGPMSPPSDTSPES